MSLFCHIKNMSKKSKYPLGMSVCKNRNLQEIVHSCELFTHFTVCYCCSVTSQTMTMTLKVFGNFLDNCMNASWSKQCCRKSKKYHSRDLRHFHSGSHHSVCNGGSEVSWVTAGDMERKRKRGVGWRKKVKKKKKNRWLTS